MKPLHAASLATAEADSLLSGRFIRLLSANFCFFLTFATFFLLPLHVRALGGSERMIGVVMGTGGIAGLVSIFVVAPLLDRLGRRVFLLGGLAALGAASVSFLFVERVGPLLVILRVLQGCAFAAGFNAASTLAAEFAPPTRRAAALGLFGVSTLVTHALAPAIGELIVATGGFHVLFATTGVYALIGLVIAWPLPGPPPPRAAPPAFRLGELPGFNAALAAVGCCGIAFGTVLTYVPTFIKDLALGPVSTFFLSYTGAAVMTRLFGGGLSDSLGRRTVIVPALALLVASVIALACVHSVPGLIGAGLLFGTAQGVAYPTLNALAVDRCEPTQLGRAQTFYNGAFNIGVTVGSFVLGVVVEAYGHRVAFLCAAGAAALGLAVFEIGTGGGRS